MNMILALECAAACVVFGVVITGSTLCNKTAWLHEYAPEVQKRFLEKNPDYVPKDKKTKTASLIAAKCAVSLLFAAVLAALAVFAGARDFMTGALYSYIIWTVVNVMSYFSISEFLPTGKRFACREPRIWTENMRRISGKAFATAFSEYS